MVFLTTNSCFTSSQLLNLLNSADIKFHVFGNRKIFHHVTVSADNIILRFVAQICS